MLLDEANRKDMLLSKVDHRELMARYQIGEATYQDIIEEIKRPGRDIRDEVEIVQLNQDVRDIKDLKEGMILNGTVRNIMDFGNVC